MTCCGKKKQKTVEENSLIQCLCIPSIGIQNMFPHCQMSSAVWRSRQIECRREKKPQESAWSWTWFSAFSLTNPHAFTQNVRSWASHPSVTLPIIIRHQPNSNRMCIYWDYLQYWLLWHTQPTISYRTHSTLEVILFILRFIIELQLLNY